MIVWNFQISLVGAVANRPYKNAPIISCRLLRKWYYNLHQTTNSGLERKWIVLFGRL
jgi:hypothetical protein